MAASAILRSPEEHQHQTIHHAGGEPVDQHGPGDDEHLRRHARHEALCLSQVKHKIWDLLVEVCPNPQDDRGIKMFHLDGYNTGESSLRGVHHESI